MLGVRHSFKTKGIPCVQSNRCILLFLISVVFTVFALIENTTAWEKGLLNPHFHCLWHCILPLNCPEAQTDVSTVSFILKCSVNMSLQLMCPRDGIWRAYSSVWRKVYRVGRGITGVLFLHLCRSYSNMFSIEPFCSPSLLQVKNYQKFVELTRVHLH